MLTGLLQQAHKLKFLAEANSTAILTGLGVAGTVGTAYLSGRASFKAGRILEAEQVQFEAFMDHELKDELEARGLGKSEPTTKSKVQAVWHLYIPAVGVGVLTITSILLANRISSKKIAALVVASGISDRAFTEYKAKVIEKLGQRQDQKIRDDVAQDQVNKHPIGTREIILAGTGEVLCFDQLTGRYFQSTVESIKRAENKVNYELIHFMSASLTMFYDEVGLPPTDYTDSVGWNLGNKMEVQLSTVMSTDGRPCIAVGFVNAPRPDYNDAWR